MYNKLKLHQITMLFFSALLAVSLLAGAFPNSARQPMQTPRRQSPLGQDNPSTGSPEKKKTYLSTGLPMRTTWSLPISWLPGRSCAYLQPLNRARISNGRQPTTALRSQ